MEEIFRSEHVTVFNPLLQNSLMMLPGKVEQNSAGSGGVTYGSALEKFSAWCFDICQRVHTRFIVLMMAKFTREQKVGITAVDLANKVSCLGQMMMQVGYVEGACANMHKATILYREIDELGPKPDEFYVQSELRRPYSEMRAGCANGYAICLYAACLDLKGGLAEYKTALRFANKLPGPHPMKKSIADRIEFLKEIIRRNKEVEDAGYPGGLFADPEFVREFQQTQGGIVGDRGFSFGNTIHLPQWERREEIAEG